MSIATDNAEVVKEQNEDYMALCASRLGNDKYSERGIQTFNNHSKHKEAATNPMQTVDVGCEVSSSFLWDAFVSTNCVKKAKISVYLQKFW